MGAEKGTAKKLKVSFTQQQRELLEKLRQEAKFGKTYEEIVINVFRDYAKQQLGVR